MEDIRDNGGEGETNIINIDYSHAVVVVGDITQW